MTMHEDFSKTLSFKGFSFLQGVLLVWMGLLFLNWMLFPPYPGAWLYVAAALGEILLTWILLRGSRRPRTWWGIGYGLLALTPLVMVGTAFLIEEWPETKLPLLAGFTRQVTWLMVTVPVPDGLRLLYPNTLALMAVPVVPLQVALLADGLVARMGRRNQPRAYRFLVLLALFTIPVTLGLLLASQSRAGLVALAAGIGFMVIGLLPKWLRGLTLLGMGLLLWRIRPELVVWWQENEGHLRTLVGRFTLWHLALFIVWGFSLTGIGFRSLRFWYPRLFPPDLYPEVTGIRTNAHNAYVQMAADMGLPGLLWYLALTFGVFFLWFRLWSRRREGSGPWSVSPGLLLGLGGSWVALMVFGLGESNGPGFFFQGWALAALIEGLYQAWKPASAPSRRRWRWGMAAVGGGLLALALVGAGPWNAWSLRYRQARLLGQTPPRPPEAHLPGWLWVLHQHLEEGQPPLEPQDLILLERAAPRWKEVSLALGWYFHRRGNAARAAYYWRMGEHVRALSQGMREAWEKGDVVAAEIYARTAYETDAEKGLMTWVTFLRRRKRDDVALQVLQETIARFPKSPLRGRWWMEVGHIQRAQGDCQAAEAAYRQAIASTSDWPWWRGDAVLRRMMCLYRLGRREEALAQVQVLLQAQPEDGRGHWGMAWIYHQDGAYEEADRWFQLAVERNPQSRWWWLTWANMWRDAPEDRRDLDRALVLYDTIIQRFPTWSLAYYHKARALEMQGRMDEAGKTYEQGLQLETQPSARHWLQLARYWEAAGKADRALTAYCQALRWQPQRQEIQQRIEALGGEGFSCSP